MVYSINQKVINLAEYGKEEFRRELLRLDRENSIYDKTNADWFVPLSERIDNYEEWFFLFDDDKPVAFSTIQKYYEGCYRLLTRTYIYRDYRRFTSPRKETIMSPTSCIIPYQSEYVKDAETTFVSMQDLKKRNALERLGKKIGENLNQTWQMAPNMMLTCEKDWGETCWQSVVYSGKKPRLEEITIEEWKNRYD